MFLCGLCKDEVLEIITRSLRSPDDSYVQEDGAMVAVKRFPYPIGEMVNFDRKGNLITRLISTVKVIYGIDRHGDYYIITAFPLVLKNTR